MSPYPTFANKIDWLKRIATPLWVYAVAACLLALGIGIAAARIETVYLRNFPYFYDTVGYYLYNGRLEARLQTQDRFQVALNEWLKNDRYPLRTIPVVLFAPQLLSNPMSHLVTALPMFAIFLFLLAWTVYKRTNNLLYGLACITLFSTLRGMFDPQGGLAVFWLDLHAAFLTGAAGLCLINSSGARNLRWLAAFALFAALAGLSRFVAAGYIFVMAAPILALYLLRRWKQERDFLRAVVLPMAVVGVIVVLLDGYFLIAHTKDNLDFYSGVSGYNLYGDIKVSAAGALSSLKRFIDFPLTSLILIGLFVSGLLLGLVNITRARADAPNTFLSKVKQLFRSGNVIRISAPPGWNWIDSLGLAWFAISHLLFIIFVIKLVNDWRTPLYALPFLFLVAVVPLPWHRASLLTALGTWLAIGILAYSLYAGIQNNRDKYAGAWLPSAYQQQMKRFYVNMGQSIAAQGEHLIAMTYFDTMAPMPVAESYFRFGKFSLFPTQQAGRTLLNDQNDAIWQQQYAGMSPTQVSNEIYDKVKKYVDVVMVFDDPDRAKGRFRNEYGRTIALTVALNVRNDPQWRRIFIYDSPEYGPVAGYRNLSPEPGGFDWLVWQQSLSVP